MKLPVFRDSLLWQEEQTPDAMPNGDRSSLQGLARVLHFAGPRRVLSSSPWQGGVREDLRCAVNINMQAFHPSVSLRSESYAEELALLLREAGLEPLSATALGTAAWMERAAEAMLEDEGLWVHCCATGGIDRNGVRAGDPASYRERAGGFEALDDPEEGLLVRPPAGTLNLVISTNAALSAGGLVKALITVTEAKTAALTDLELPSVRSAGLATGSGTDGVILVSMLETEEGSLPLSDAGTHSRLGELLARSVYLAVRRSLLVNCAAATPRAHSVMARIKRYGITPVSLWEYDRRMQAEGFLSPLDAASFEKRLDALSHDSSTLVSTVLFLALLDQHRTGLLEWGEVYREGLSLLRFLPGEEGLSERLEAREKSRALPLDLRALTELLQDVLCLRLRRFEYVCGGKDEASTR